jgi:hypothetical protein
MLSQLFINVCCDSHVHFGVPLSTVHAWAALLTPNGAAYIYRIPIAAHLNTFPLC